MLILLSLLFCSIFGIWINSRALISNMTSSKRVFLVQIWDFLFFHKAFHFDKFEGTNFKYGYNFLNLNPKIIQKRHFWFQVWKFIVLHKILLMTYSKMLAVFLVFLDWNLKTILSYLKSAPSNLSNCKTLRKNKKCLNLGPKEPYLDIFGLEF